MSEPITEFRFEGQVVLILCGLIGSGKSTFAKQLEEHYPQFRRCNQDELGDRRKVEQLARQCLNKRLSVCIDRTNFDDQQRSHWIRIAREYPGTSIWVIVFDTPYKVCAARLEKRTSHPTIKSLEQGLEVLSRFLHDFRQPHPSEGFDSMISLKPEDTSLVYTSSEITAILRRAHDASLVSSSNHLQSNPRSQPFQGRPFYRRNSNRGYPPRYHLSASHESFSGVHGPTSMDSMSGFVTLQSPRNGTTARGAGRPWRNNSRHNFVSESSNLSGGPTPANQLPEST